MTLTKRFLFLALFVLGLTCLYTATAQAGCGKRARGFAASASCYSSGVSSCYSSGFSACYSSVAVAPVVTVTKVKVKQRRVRGNFAAPCATPFALPVPIAVGPAGCY